MPKKEHEAEHENLERWLVSYADFITLLFATFVVLYALSQSDIAEFEKMQDSIRKAFAAPSILSGSDGMMNSQGKNLFNQGSSPDDQSAIPPLLEYMSQKYEQKSFEQIKESLDSLNDAGEISGIEAEIHERGLVINIHDLDLFFKSATAELKPQSFKALQKISKLIRKKFSSHLIRVEGHTDNLPIKSSIYPSNWELSSARASSVVRYIINHSKMKKELFASLGYADTRPKDTNDNEKGRQKNRRVEIVILRNKLTKAEPEMKGVLSTKLKEKPRSANESIHSQTNQYSEHKTTYKEHKVLSDAARKLMQESEGSSENVIILKDGYDKDTNKIMQSLEKFEQQRIQRDRTIEKNVHHQKPQKSQISKKRVFQENKEDHNIFSDLIKNAGNVKNLLNSNKDSEKH